ncbi:MAG: hypothetical protein QOG88_1419 [Actinomycetota bacterium]|jgi:hypothetical protein|nr:hypothetical protein [Actinomycetota bacterium]
MQNRVRVAIGMSALAVAMAGCGGGPSVATGSDPVASASTLSQLPPNIGASGCNPASKTTDVNGNTEVSGQNGKDTTFWALFPGGKPFPSGQDLRVRFAVNGEHAVRIILGGPDGQEIRLDQVYPDFGADWGRPGDIWAAIVNFPTSGCWRVSADRIDKHADFWVQVG